MLLRSTAEQETKIDAEHLNRAVSLTVKRRPRSLGADTLQLAFGAVERAGRGATILYPTAYDKAREQAIAISDPVLGRQRATVIVRLVNLDKLENLIQSSACDEHTKAIP